MLSSKQTLNLRNLHDALSGQNDVGPVDPPRVGERYHCCGGRTYWLRDVTMLQFARRLAVQIDPRCRRRQRVLGIPMGRRLDPMVEHYGLTPEQIDTMIEIDNLPIPDADHDGRLVWIKRHQNHILEVIAAGTANTPPPAYVNNLDDSETLLVTTEVQREEPVPVR